MKKSLLLIIGTSLIFFSCNAAPTKSIDENLSKWPWFSIQSSVEFEKRIERPDGSMAFITYDNTQILRDTNDLGIYIYIPDSCPLLGVSENNLMIINGNSWGKVDFWNEPDALNGWSLSDDRKPEDVPPFCKPPFPEMFEIQHYVPCTKDDDQWSCASKQRQYELDHGMYSAYAFCAEKDGKAVAICIQQMTDDEAMAKEIFESFRWTE